MLANPKGNPQNFRPFSPDEARKNGSKGGKAKGEKALVRKTLREALLDRLSDQKTQDAMIDAIIKQATKEGNIKAFEVIRDTIGEKPVDRVMVSDVDPSVIEEVERMVNDDA